MNKQTLNTIKTILKQNKVKKAGLFGSYSTNTQVQDSDIDILVELSDNFSLFDFIGLKQELEDNLNKKIDLVEYKAIKKVLRDSILQSEIRILG